MSAITLPFLEKNTPFPHVETALKNPDGLLAFGGDLSVSRLINAYENGIFPWFSEDDPLLWWSPGTRAIIHTHQFHISKSLRKLIRQQRFSLSVNKAFNDVIDACAKVPRIDNNGETAGTWITQTMIDAYKQLHRENKAHSIEVFDSDKLIGGLYGVVTGSVFCGESMFHKRDNASKLAMAGLVSLLQPYSQSFIDCQMPTDHLLSLGAQTLSRKNFIAMLTKANQLSLPESLWVSRDFTPCLI